MHQRRPRGRWLVAMLLVVITAGPGGLIGPVSTAAFDPSPGPWIELVANLLNPITAALHVVAPGEIDKGSDGRLTVMLVGSDWRERLAGHSESEGAVVSATIHGAKQKFAV